MSHFFVFHIIVLNLNFPTLLSKFLSFRVAATMAKRQKMQVTVTERNLKEAKTRKVVISVLLVLAILGVLAAAAYGSMLFSSTCLTQPLFYLTFRFDSPLFFPTPFLRSS